MRLTKKSGGGVSNYTFYMFYTDNPKSCKSC